MAGPDRESRSAVAISLLLGFAAAFVMALLEFRAAHIISRFAILWEVSRAASLLATWMPPLLFAACAASMSLHREPGLRFSQVIRPVLVPALVLALIFSTIELTVLPGIRGAQKSYESLSHLFYDALKEAEEALQAQDIARAQERISLCGAIDSRENTYKALNEKIKRAFLQIERETDSGKTVKTPPAEPSDSGASAYELYVKARNYFRQGDFYSAHWYAGKAVLLDPSRRDARLLQAEAWSKITATSEDPEDRARADFHARKVQAYTMLQSGDYLGSYRAFSNLSKEVPKDADVLRYRKESLDRLSKTAFFADDYRRAFASESIPDFAVRVRRGDVDHIIYAARVAPAGSFLYLEGFEYLQTNEKGPTLHVSAPYARLRGLVSAPPKKAESKSDEAPSCTVSLRRVERDTPSEATSPRYLIGNSAPTGDAVLELPMDFEALSTLLILRDDPLRVSFFRLVSGAQIAEEYGWDPSPYRFEIALRVSVPLVLVILVLLGTAIGARFRREEEPSRLRMIFILPILTILASVPLNVANAVGKEILSRLYGMLSPAVAMTTWAGFLAILLGISLLAVGRLGVHAPD